MRLYSKFNFNCFFRCILSAIEEVRQSSYFQSVHKAVSSNLPLGSIVDIVCFGLGHIGESIVSRYQLALLICLKEVLCARKVSVHDPIFFKSECEILHDLDLDIIKENTEGSYIIANDCITLSFLPHCSKQLINNFLWSNWGPGLANCILIGNSISSLLDNQFNRHVLTVPYIQNISTYTKEIKLNNNFKFTDIFNDISVHIFPKLELEELAKTFWEKGDQPVYENNEEFITKLMIDKLKV